MKNTLATYVNGSNLVILYEDGTKVRVENGKSLFPESMDVKITNYCDVGCTYCHEMSTPSGKHASLDNLELFDTYLYELPDGIEIAIGGGNPLAHPDIEEFLVKLKSHGKICNLTVNEQHFFEPEYQKMLEYFIESDLIKGLGYSYYSEYCDMKYEHLVNHVVVGVTPFSELEKIVTVNKKVLLLGFKFDTGFGINFGKNPEVQRNIEEWKYNLKEASKIAKLSFDNLAIKQLEPRSLFSSDEEYSRFYMGDDGEHTMYFDLVKGEYASSSTSKTRFGFDNSSDIYRIFEKIKKEVTL